MQDWYALRNLLEQGVVRPGDVVLPGHTIGQHARRAPPGGAARHPRSGGQGDPHSPPGAPGDQRRAYADPYQAAKVRAFLALRPFTGSPRDVQSILESYNVRERQTGHINNSMRAYEHLGLEWALPMLDVGSGTPGTVAPWS